MVTRSTTSRVTRPTTSAVTGVGVSGGGGNADPEDLVVLTGAPKPASSVTLNTGHALSDNLAACYLMQEGTGTTVADKTSNANTLTLSANCGWSTNKNGFIVSANAQAVAPATLATAIAMNGTGDWTVAFRCRLGYGRATGMVCGDNTTSQSYIHFSSTTNLRFLRAGGGQTNYTVSDATVAMRDYCLVHDNTAGTVSLYVDGVFVSSAAIDAVLTINTLFNGLTTFSSAFIGLMEYFYVWNGRALSSTDAEAISDDPYQIYTASDSLNIARPRAREIVQISGSGAENRLPIIGRYYGTPTAIEARFNGGDWTRIVESPSGGVFSGTLQNLSPGQGNVEVRFRNDTGVTASNTLVGLGHLIVTAGQSNMAGSFSANATYSHASFVPSVADFNDVTWRELADPTHDNGSGSFIPHLATLMMESEDAPVAFITLAVTGTALVSGGWSPPNGNNYRTLRERLEAMAPVYQPLCYIWDQGESDANAAVSQAAYNSALDTLISTAKTETGYTSPWVIAMVGTSALGTGANPVRLAQREAWGDNADVLIGITSIDRADLHWNDAQSGLIAGRWWSVLDRQLLGGSGNPRGPLVTAAWKDGSTVVVRFDKNLDTSVSSYTAAAFTVNNDDGPARSVSSVARTNATDITITCDGAIDGTAPTVTFGSENSAAGATIPTGEPITLPATVNSTSAVVLPVEMFIDYAVAASAP